jgi:Flp pilus assembly protein TadD
MQSGDLTNAVPHFTEAIRLEPDYTQAREHLTSALEQLGGTNAAPGTVPR